MADGIHIDTDAELMSQRMAEYTDLLSVRGMGFACAAGLRPIRRIVRRRNFGFSDRTGRTRRNIGRITTYSPATRQRRGGNGAYFRHGSLVAARLEYDYGGKYSFIRPAVRIGRAAMERAFLTRARVEADKYAELVARRKLQAAQARARIF